MTDAIKPRAAQLLDALVDLGRKREAIIAALADLDGSVNLDDIIGRCADLYAHERKALLKEVRTASPDQGLRQVVRADPCRVRRLAVEDPGILKGVNRPGDLPGRDDPEKRSGT